MKHTGLIIALLAAALLAACEEKPYNPPVPKTELDKAKGVERTIEQAGRDREEAAEKAGR